MKKCYSPNYEGREIEVFDTHTFDKNGDCVICGEIMTANDHITDLKAKLKLAVEALSDARSHLFAIYNGDWPSDISPTPAGFAQFAVNDIDATLAKIKEPSKGRDR